MEQHHQLPCLFSAAISHSWPCQEVMNDNPVSQWWGHHRLHQGQVPECMFEEFRLRFEEKLLTITTHFAERKLQLESDSTHLSVSLPLRDSEEVTIPYETSWSYSTMVQVDKEEVQKWKNAYMWDPHFNLVCKSKEEDEGANVTSPQYHYSKEALIYFVDSTRNMRLCIPKDLCIEVMQEANDTITKAAHGGYFKTYNIISATYYWPWMSREIKVFVNTCDICQKIKPRLYGSIGLLQSILIPSQPFRVMSMDFIPELLTSNGFNNILVVVDKLTKYTYDNKGYRSRNCKTVF